MGAANLLALLKSVIGGLLTAEAFYLGKAIVNCLSKNLIETIFQNLVIIIIILCPLIFIYALVRGFFIDAWKIIKSMRFDIYISYLLGIFVSISFTGIGTCFYKQIFSYLNSEQILTVVLLPEAIGLLLLIHATISYFIHVKRGDPFFIPDTEEKSKENDLLDYADQATLLAERIFNNGSDDSLVFGIDAPWGVGKSSFINFCIESFEDKKYNNRVAVYKFNPLKYEDRKNLLEKFIDGLVSTIQKSTFKPEIKSLISHYSRLIRTETSAHLSFFGIKVKLSPGINTVDDIFKDLEVALKNFNKKIIIVVDDLDRLDIDTIKDILFTLKMSFKLPNLSYILCYDTENIGALSAQSPDNEKIMEFFEKFVNVKVSLFLDNNILAKYVTDNFKLALQHNPQIDPTTREKIKETISALVKIYNSQEAHLYHSFIGDIRKLKRLINTMMLFKIEETDFENSDFDKRDLIHLILIYINYPNIFRKIYLTETGGKRGFFSAINPFDDAYPKPQHGNQIIPFNDRPYENSPEYIKYLEKLNNEKQKFLLNQVFDISKRLEGSRMIGSVAPTVRKTYACFNGGIGDSGKNLEEYLHLIVKLVKPPKKGQYNFYLNARNMVKDGANPRTVFESFKEFSFLESENTHTQFWNVVVDSSREFDSKMSTILIDYIITNITDYSLFENDELGVGLRHSIVRYIVKLLNDIGWSDQNGEHVNDTGKNISEIAEWIFGEKRHLDNGVIGLLSKEERGIMGFYDLLTFRLFCSSDRGGDIFNLEKALLNRADTSNQTGVSDSAVTEMREISQKIFFIFKSQYIDRNLNIFELIDNLTLENITGKYFTYINENILSGKIKDSEKTIDQLKSRIKSYIIYQLGNPLISLGVGCGYYDPSGNDDKKEIQSQMNDYLFEVCFNPSKGNGFENFLDYLLINYSHNSPLESKSGFAPNLNEFLKVIKKERLIDYWNKNSTQIKGLNFISKNKVVQTLNYIASYKEDLPNVYKLLDDLVKENPPNNLPPLLLASGTGK